MNAQKSQPCGSYAKHDGAKHMRPARERMESGNERGQARTQIVVARQLVCRRRSYEGEKFVTGMCVVGSQVYFTLG